MERPPVLSSCSKGKWHNVKVYTTTHPLHGCMTFATLYVLFYVLDVHDLTVSNKTVVFTFVTLSWEMRTVGEKGLLNWRATLGSLGRWGLNLNWWWKSCQVTPDPNCSAATLCFFIKQWKTHLQIHSSSQWWPKLFCCGFSPLQAALHSVTCIRGWSSDVCCLNFQMWNWIGGYSQAILSLHLCAPS